MLLAIALAAVMLAAGVEDAMSEDEHLALWDVPVLRFFAEHRAAWLTPWVAGFTRVGSSPVLAPLLVLAAGLLSWRRRDAYPFLLLAVTAAGSVAGTVLLKGWLGRPRPPYDLAVPPWETSGSFPSGHTLNSTALALVLLALLLRSLPPRGRSARRRVLAWVACLGMALYVAAMGCSRLYLGAHWFTDVVAGWLLGFAWAAFVLAVEAWWRGARGARGRERAVLGGPGPSV